MRRAISAFFILLLAACGGGGGGSSGGGGGGGAAVNQVPSAVAGSGQSGVIGQLLTFSGAGSTDPEGTSLTYAWTLQSAPAGNTATLAGAGTVSPSIRPNVAGTYTLALTVSDGSLSSTASTTTATVTVDAANQAQQQAAHLSGTVDGDGTTARLDWKDSFPAGASYRIELQNTDGSFTALETVAGVGGGAAAMQWSRAYTGPATFRVVALTNSRELPLLNTQGQSTVALSLPPISISFTAAEPLSGTVPVSVASLPAGATVAWYLDLATLGTGSPYNWNTTGATNGSHLLQAIVDLGGGSFVDLRRTVTTANSNLALTVIRNVTGGTTNFLASASSQFGIAQVSSRMDGGPPQTLTAMNVCSGISCRGSNPTPNYYGFAYSLSALGSGVHTAVIRATDSNGAAKEVTYPFDVANPPVLTVTTPVSGQFASGTLHVDGNYTTDTGSPATVRASLGAVQFLQTTSANFSADFSLAGVTPGAYTLTVTATDVNNAVAAVQRQITVTSTGALAYVPLFTVPSDAQIRDAEGDAVVYSSGNNIMFAQAVGAASAVQLQDVLTGVDDNKWQILGDWVYGSASTGSTATGGCAAFKTCVFRWSLMTGARSTFSALDPAAGSLPNINHSSLVAKDGFAAWWSSGGGNPRSITLYQDSTGNFSNIIAPAGIVEVSSFDFSVTGGSPTLVFVGRSSSGGSTVTDTVYKWTSAGGFSAVVSANTTSSGSHVFTTYASGASLIYGRLTVGPETDTFSFPISKTTLTATPLAGGATTTLATDSRGVIPVFSRDGVFAWTFTPVSGTVALKYRAWSAAQGVVELTNTASASSGDRARSGFYAFRKPDGEYVWNGTTGVQTKKIDGGPFALYLTGNWIYFKSGDTIFRTALN